tara:strand:- start:39 stop:518 length:480 start_codon:yes stop_codon:yes gene_type:complete
MTELKPPKPTKKGIVKTIIGAIPAAIKNYRKKQKKFKKDEQAFVKQEKDKVTKGENIIKNIQKKNVKRYEDLSPKQKKMFDKLGTSNPGMSTAKKIAIATGLTAGTAVGAGGIKFVGDVKEQMEKNRMAGGGMVKKRAKTKSSRGTGAAIRGKKFKGVF